MLIREHASASRMLVAGLALAAAAWCAGVAPASAQGDGASPPYRDLSFSAEARAADLVSRMTLEEKAAQFINDAPAIPRLGVREYNWWNEGLHGVAAAGEATVFPQAIGMAATWNEPLIGEVADVISIEFRANYLENRHRFGGSDWFSGLTVWSPNINIFRDPRWGRGQETYGEDPYLTARLGVAFVRGLQGDDPRYLRTVATPKHYAVHSGPEPSRHRDDIHPSARDLHDTYLPAFRATVMECGALSVMCAYNAIDGAPACANAPLLRTYLRESWGFSGYVVSDCDAVANIYRAHEHHYTRRPEEGVAVAFRAGMDLICGGANETEHIHSAVRQGLLTEAELDVSLRRLFTARMRLGQFDPPAQVFPAIAPADNDTDAHRALALRVAEQSMVLLKNENNLLPLRQAPRTIAVIGPNADSLEPLVGDAVQETWLAVLRGLRRLEDPARFPGWVYSIATRRCADAIRGRVRLRAFRDESQSDPTSAETSQRADERLDMRGALSRLPREQAVVMAMFYGADLSVEEIAGVLSIPAGTVKSRLHHARETLRTILGKE